MITNFQKKISTFRLRKDIFTGTFLLKIHLDLSPHRHPGTCLKSADCVKIWVAGKRPCVHVVLYMYAFMCGLLGTGNIFGHNINYGRLAAMGCSMFHNPAGRSSHDSWAAKNSVLLGDCVKILPDWWARETRTACSNQPWHGLCAYVIAYAQLPSRHSFCA